MLTDTAGEHLHVTRLKSTSHDQIQLKFLLLEEIILCAINNYSTFISIDYRIWSMNIFSSISGV